MRYGSKQDLHIISRGMLGDAMKQILAFGDILVHIHDDGNTFEDAQWNDPLIIRHNKKELKIYLKVDKVKQNGFTIVEESCKLDHTDTEVELVLPVIDDVTDNLTRGFIEDYCKKYPTFTTDITYKFSITDNSNPICTESPDYKSEEAMTKAPTSILNS